jgi:hypothetical protein
VDSSKTKKLSFEDLQQVNNNDCVCGEFMLEREFIFFQNKLKEITLLLSGSFNNEELKSVIYNYRRNYIQELSEIDFDLAMTSLDNHYLLNKLVEFQTNKYLDSL